MQILDRHAVVPAPSRGAPFPLTEARTSPVDGPFASQQGLVDESPAPPASTSLP